ncbi:MAG: RNA repair domain-containing protein [Candidatus Aenigmatarchaeota archaeon]
MSPYQILGKLKWTGEIKKAEILIRHRGAPNDVKRITGGCITHIARDRFFYKNDIEATIPMHRILEIKIDNKIVWRKSVSKSHT